MSIAQALAGSLWFWAWGVAALGWIYCALAHLGPVLFHRLVIRIAVRQADGYRVGRGFYWRLRARVALPLAVVSGAPLLAAGMLPQSWASGALGLLGVALVPLWLTRPPGRCLGISAPLSAAGQPALITLRPIDPWWRGIVVLVAYGVIPACAAGWALSALTSLITR